MQAGESEAKFAALSAYATSDQFSERERTALAFADRMTRTDLDVDDAFFAEASAAFSPGELVELAAVIAGENFRSKFNNAFRIEAQGFCALPPLGEAP